MTKTLIWAVALIVSALILANGGINAQRVMIPPEEPSPTPTQQPAESDATPVMVENFPTAQTVDVRSFPHVVTVEGTVDVGNFPTTQNVAGTMDVGNLPLDAEGNIRVSGATTNPSYKFMKVATNISFVNGVPININPIQVGGWRHVQFTYHVTSDDNPGAVGPQICVSFGGDGVFAQDVTCLGVGYSQTVMFGANVLGPEANLRLQLDNNSQKFVDVWAYLSN